VLLAWGVGCGRGGGLTGVLVPKDADTDADVNRAIANLCSGSQLGVALLALTASRRTPGLSVGNGSPPRLGAFDPAGLRRRLAPSALRGPSMSLSGGGAGSVLPFNQPCWGPLRARNSRRVWLQLLVRHLLLAASGTPCSIPSWEQPARLAKDGAAAGACPAAPRNLAHAVWRPPDRCACWFALLVPFAQRLGLVCVFTSGAAALAIGLLFPCGGAERISLNDGSLVSASLRRRTCPGGPGAPRLLGPLLQ